MNRRSVQYVLNYKQLPRVTYGQAVRSDTKYVLVVNVGQNVQPHDLDKVPHWQDCGEVC